MPCLNCIVLTKGILKEHPALPVERENASRPGHQRMQKQGGCGGAIASWGRVCHQGWVDPSKPHPDCRSAWFTHMLRSLANPFHVCCMFGVRNTAICAAKLTSVCMPMPATLLS